MVYSLHESDVFACPVGVYIQQLTYQQLCYSINSMRVLLCVIVGVCVCLFILCMWYVHLCVCVCEFVFVYVVCVRVRACVCARVYDDDPPYHSEGHWWWLAAVPPSLPGIGQGHSTQPLPMKFRTWSGSKTNPHPQRKEKKSAGDCLRCMCAMCNHREEERGKCWAEVLLLTSSKKNPHDSV